MMCSAIDDRGQADRRRTARPVLWSGTTALLLCLMLFSRHARGGRPARAWARKAGAAKSAKASGESSFLVPDDPLMNHLLVKMVRSRTQSSGWGPRMQGPGLFLGYRLASFLCQVRSCWYHQGVVMAYPVALLESESAASRLFRFGLGMEAGAETTLHPRRSWQHHQALAGLFSVGVQYPWRVTPFGDFVVGLGVVHRNLYNKDYFDFAYSFGLDVGVSIFVVGRFHVTASVGWRRWAVRSEVADLYVDSWSMTTGLGF